MTDSATENTDLRACSYCKEPYSPSALQTTNGHYFAHPFRYSDGVDSYCLACWLGVGSNAIATPEKEITAGA